MVASQNVISPSTGGRRTIATAINLLLLMLAGSTLAMSLTGGQLELNSREQANGSNQNNNNYDVSPLLEMGPLSPVSSALKFAMPNTYQGFTSDLNNGVNMIGSAGLNRFGQLTSSMQSSKDNTINRFTNFEQNLANKFVENQDMLLKLYEMALNPEQMCRALAQQTQHTYNSANQQAQAAYQQAMQMPGQYANSMLTSANNQVNSLMQQTPADTVSQLMNSQPAQQAQQAAQTGSSMMKKIGFPFGK